MTTQAPQAVAAARILSATLTLDLLRIGTILTGRVAAVAPDGKVRLETPGGSLQFQSNAALNKGDIVRLEVGRDNGQTTLRIVDHRPATPSAQQTVRPAQISTPLPQPGQTPVPAQTAGPAQQTVQPASVHPVRGQPVQPPPTSLPSGQAQPAVPPASTLSGSNATLAGARQTGAVQSPQSASPSPASPTAIDSNGQTTSPQTAVAAATREAAARQGSLAPFFTTLASMPASAAPIVPAAAQAIFERLLGLRLSLDSAPTADDLETALQRSGVFHEAGQARGAAQQGQGADLKALLTLMRRAMPQTDGGQQTPPPGEPRPALPDARGRPEPQRPMVPLDTDRPVDELMNQLARQGDAALSRLKLLQMASLPERGDRGAEAVTRDVVLDVPIVRDGQNGVMQFRVTRDESNPGQADAKGPIWRVRFAVDLEETGAIDALVTLQQGRIGVAIWADRKTTADALSAHLTDLDAAIRAAELDIDTLNVRQGRAPAAEPRPSAPVFVDIAS